MEKSVDFTDGSQEYFCAVAADVKGPKIRTGSPCTLYSVIFASLVYAWVE